MSKKITTQVSEQSDQKVTRILLPILFGFFIMGFVDIVGISTNYVKQDFHLSDTLANLLPFAVFFWFAIFSLPAAGLMNRIGRKKTVLLSLLLTFIGLVIPMVSYTLPMMLIAFAMIGIGNTLIQVALNPLLASVVSEKQLTSSLTAGQFIKAMASFLGPVIVAQTVSCMGNWQLVFPVFAILTTISFVWLWKTTFPYNEEYAAISTLKNTLGLLKNQNLLFCFIGILTIVGIDVGINISAPKLLMDTGLPLEKAAYATSLYFVCRTIASFAGTFLLSRWSPQKIYIVCSIVALIAFIGMLISSNDIVLYACIVLVGLACANMFSIILSYALKLMPGKANEVSALLIMGVAGGGLFPLLMGLGADAFHSPKGGISILILCVFWQLFLAFRMSAKKSNQLQ